MNEVEALYELYKKISCSIINDGLIHKVFANCSLFLQFPAKFVPSKHCILFIQFNTLTNPQRENGTLTLMLDLSLLGFVVLAPPRLQRSSKSGNWQKEKKKCDRSFA